MPALPSMSAIKTSLNGTLAHNIVRSILIIHILVTSYWPTAYVNIFQHLATRIVLALVVVGLLFWDIIAGALLAILLVITIQESKSRMTTVPANTTHTLSNANPNESVLSKMLSIFNTSTTNQIKTDLQNMNQYLPKKELVAASVYGQQQVPSITAEPERVGAYMDQIGELSITHQIKAGQGVQMIDGLPNVKVNMNQLGKSYDFNSVSDIKESLTNNLPLDRSENTEYDHPANKTMSENLRVRETGFITDKNLLDAQINSVSGLDGSKPPCFVASETGIWNAQGFGSIARAVDNEACPHSFV